MKPIPHRSPPCLSILLLLLPILLLLLHNITPTLSAPSSSHLIPSHHTANHAIILDSSVFFHNYRHTSNALTIYHSLKVHGGFTDDNIVLFLADEIACNGRNPVKESVLPLRTMEHGGHGHGSGSRSGGTLNLYDGYVEVDYSGEDVTVDNFLRVLQGRHPPSTPPSKKLPNTPAPDGTSGTTHLFLYITGHGGDGFFKFRDREELMVNAFRRALDELQFRGRYSKILFVSDTCQAFTLAPNTPELDDNQTKRIVPFWDRIIGGGGGGEAAGLSSSSPLRNVYSIGSSVKDFNSYSHHSDNLVGHSVIDRYVYNLMEYMGWMHHHPRTNHHHRGSGSSRSRNGNWKWDRMDHISVKEAMVDSMYNSRRQSLLGSQVGWTDHGCDIKMEHVPLSDFLVMKQTSGGNGHGGGHGHGVRVKIIDEEVYFPPTIPRSMTKGEEEEEEERDNDTIVPKDENPTTVGESKIETEGREEDTVFQGTNPSSSFFVVSTLISVLVVRFSSPYLW